MPLARPCHPGAGRLFGSLSKGLQARGKTWTLGEKRDYTHHGRHLKHTCLVQTRLRPPANVCNLAQARQCGHTCKPVRATLHQRAPARSANCRSQAVRPLPLSWSSICSNFEKKGPQTPGTTPQTHVSRAVRLRPPANVRNLLQTKQCGHRCKPVRATLHQRAPCALGKLPVTSR